MTRISRITRISADSPQQIELQASAKIRPIRVIRVQTLRDPTGARTPECRKGAKLSPRAPVAPPRRGAGDHCFRYTAVMPDADSVIVDADHVPITLSLAENLIFTALPFSVYVAVSTLVKFCTGEPVTVVR